MKCSCKITINIISAQPLNIGFVGFISSIIGKSKWVSEKQFYHSTAKYSDLQLPTCLQLMIWTVYSTLAGIGSYAFFVKYGCLDPETFGATMRIYGNCFQEDEICKCVW